MRITRVLSLAAAALIACRSSTETSGALVTLAANPPVFSGSAVDLTLTITNTSDEDFNIIDPATSCGVQHVRLFDRFLHEIPLQPPDAVCSLAVYPPLLLHAGESVTRTVKWSPLIGVLPTDGPIYPDPGAYFIRARIESPDRGELPGELISFKIFGTQPLGL